jgi:hypothetical protein
MIPDILRKMETLLNTGITTEPEVVYLMPGIRKLLEQQQAKQQYKYLTFHCDWTLHSKLEGTGAQEILRKFDAANLHLKNGVDYNHLPRGLRNEIDKISKLKHFKKQLAAFLQADGIAQHQRRTGGWVDLLCASVCQGCGRLPFGDCREERWSSGDSERNAKTRTRQQSDGR